MTWIIQNNGLSMVTVKNAGRKPTARMIAKEQANGNGRNRQVSFTSI